MSAPISGDRGSVDQMARRSKARSPRRARMSRAARLQSARAWLKTFSGKRVVPSYAKWFAVDLACAAKELQILGIRFSPEYLDALRRTIAGRRTRRRAKAKEAEVIEDWWDQEFAFIARYTEGGAPFGVTWDELESIDNSRVPGTEDDDGKATE